jgi:hypothetical protein
MLYPPTVDFALLQTVATNNTQLFTPAVTVSANKSHQKNIKNRKPTKHGFGSEIHYEDSRGFHILPNNKEASYYIYGTPENGQGQFAHPLMLGLIFWVDVQWGMMDTRKFGVGNISLYNGRSF